MSKKYKFHFKVPRITCNGCKSTIIHTLLNSNRISVSVDDIHINVASKKVRLVVSEIGKQSQAILSESQLFQIVQAELSAAGFDFGPEESAQSHYLKGAVGIGFGTALMLLPILGLAMTPMAMAALSIASTMLILYLGKDSFFSAYKEFSTRKALTVDSLFAASSLIAIVVSIASHFVPWLPMMFDAALFIFGFRHIGIGIESAAKQKVVSGLEFVDRAPDTVQVVDGKNIKIVNRKELVPGQIVRISGGAMVPVDGKLVGSNTKQKSATFYDTIITGSYLPVRVKAKKMIYAGMRVGHDVSCVDIKVTGGSYLERLDKSFMNAKLQATAIEATADKWLQYFIPGVFAFALVSGALIAMWLSPVLAVQTSVAVLLAACPCVLGFITPLMVDIGKTKAAEQGAVITDSKSLENLASVDTVFFDIHGTLSKGEQQVVRFKCSTDEDEDHILRLLYSIEVKSKHEIAQGICRYIKEEKKILDLQEPSLDVDFTGGIGAEAKMSDCQYVVGNQHMMEKYGIETEKSTSSLASQIIYIARINDHAKKIIGQVELHDPLRSDAKNVVQFLQNQGKRVCILTGAPEATAKYYARQLGISAADVKSNCRPNDKKKEIEAAKMHNGKRNVVAMVGDAENDAHALAASDIGIVIDSSGRDDMAYQSAGIAINRASLSPIINAYLIANQTVHHIKRGLIFSAVYNLLAMPLPIVLAATVGYALNPAVSVLLMLAQSCLVLAQANHFRHQSMQAIMLHHTGNRDFISTDEVAQRRLSGNRCLPSQRAEAMSVAQANPIAASQSCVGLMSFLWFRSNNAIVNTAVQQSSSPRSIC